MKDGFRSQIARSTARLAAGIACAFVLAPQGLSAPVKYDFNFTTRSGVAPTAGSFLYDPSAPDGSRFSSFVITWSGFSFDLTSSANAPYFSNRTSSCSDDVFALLAYGSACTTHIPEAPRWHVMTRSSNYRVFFYLSDYARGGADTLSISTALYLASPSSLAGGSGDWTIVQSSIPEPSSFTLMLAGALFHLLRKRAASAVPDRLRR